VYKLIRDDIVIKLGARRSEGEGEGIGGGDAAGHGGSSDLGGRRVGEGEGEDCSGEKGFRSSVKETFFFLFPFFPSAVIARVFGAICS
jgi:hypothetical protein